MGIVADILLVKPEARVTLYRRSKKTANFNHCPKHGCKFYDVKIELPGDKFRDFDFCFECWATGLQKEGKLQQ